MRGVRAAVACRRPCGDSETGAVARRILENERETAEKIAGTWDHATDLALQAAGAE